MEKGNNYLEAFINENDKTFNDFFNEHASKHLYNRNDYLQLKETRNKIYQKYPKIQQFLEDEKPTDFNIEETKAFYEVITIYSSIEKLMIKEAYKLGAKDCYIFMEDMDMINI